MDTITFALIVTIIIFAFLRLDSTEINIMRDLPAFVVLFTVIFVIAVIYKKWMREPYVYGGGTSTVEKAPLHTQYEIMSQLPFASPPVDGPDSLGYIEQQYLKWKHPYPLFPIPDLPVSCPSSGTLECGAGIRIYETGNASNPNTTSVYGVVTPEDIW